MKHLLLVLLITAIHTTGNAQVLYVHNTATGTGNGSSWADAYTTLKAAIEEANTNTAITEIRVAGGTYREMPLTMARGYAIRGSFDISTNQQDWVTQPCTIEPLDHINTVLITATSTSNYPVLVEGFRFRNAKGVAIVNRTSLTLFKCTFTDNYNPLASCILNDGALKVVNCTFINPPDAGGSMIFAISFSGIDPITHITNCTFLNHSDSAHSVVNGAGDTRISNSIIWGRASLGELQNGDTLILNRNIIASINKIPGSSATIIYTTNAATDARSISPRFNDSASGDLGLLPHSPAINKGSNTAYEAADGNSANNSVGADLDMAGIKRAYDIAIDLGAYERPYIQQTISATDIIVAYGDAPAQPPVTINTPLAVSYVSANNNIAAIITDAGNHKKIMINNKGIVSITATQPGDAQHDPADPVSFTVTVNPRPAIVTATTQNKVYGDADPALTYTTTPALVAGDAFTGSLNRGQGENVGAYAITQGSLDNSNYDISYHSANFTILKKSIIVTADAKSKTYSEADPVLTYTIAPALMGNDMLAGNITRAGDENAGDYPITQGSLDNSNYSINFVPGVFTINKAAQHVIWNQALIAPCDGSNAIALTGASSSGLPVQYASTNTTVATANNNQLTIAVPGTTTITATQPGNQNYLPAASVQHNLTARLPGYLLVKHWNDVLMFDNSSAAYSNWQWYKNGSPVNGANSQYYYESGNLNGEYYATAKNASGETLPTCPITLTPGASITPLTVFPNPAAPGQSITLKINYTAAQLQGAKLVITNHTGALVTMQSNVLPQTTLPMSLLQGLYVVRLTLATGVTHALNLLVKP